MGKLLCDSSSVSTDTLQPLLTWKESIQALDLSPATTTATTTSTWENVTGLEEQQRRNLSKLQARGVLWKPPQTQDDDDDEPSPVVFRLSHGGDVESDGNCLFTASQKAMVAVGDTEESPVDSRELRRRTVKRFLEDLGSASEEDIQMVNNAIRHMYSPDLKSGWGIHVVQELKLLAKKTDRESMDSAINELLPLGMQRETAAESIYKERCIAVDDGSSWAKYMSISGCPDDEYDIITLQYTEEGLLTVDENREGRAAAFGDDIAIECLATEFKREIYVVQAHGSDGMVDEENCVFFLPHRPRGQICGPPFFLFMKGTGWCGAGADHYEPLIATPSLAVSQEKVAFVL